MPNPYAPPDPSAPPPPQRRPEDYPRPENQQGESGGEHSTDGSGSGSGPGGPRGQRRKPTPEEAMAAGRSVLKFGAVLLVTLLAMQWPVPWQVAAPVAGAVAIYLGIRALVAYRKFGASMFTWVFLVIGVGMSVLMTFASLSLLTMWDAQLAHQNCMDRALTMQAEQACTDAYQQAVEDQLTPSGE